MHKLKTFKYKPNLAPSDNGILNKITKSYSSVSAKLSKKSPRRRKSMSPSSQIASGSYDVNARKDHQIEIGEPILISKTTIDVDRLEANNTPNRIPSIRTSSDSENEIFADATSSMQNIEDTAFQTLSNSRNNSRRKCLGQSTPLRKNRSKSFQNLHKSELRVYLQKAPSLQLDMKLTTANLQRCYDLPRNDHQEPMKFEQESISRLPEQQISNESELSTSSSTQKVFSHSVDSISRENSVPKSITNFSSEGDDSVLNLDSSLEDFNLKSVSCQSLDAKNLFLSIEELNEITRQINECEDWNGEVDREYCEHRDNLRPSERRITLLKHKNKRMITLQRNKESINNAWSGLKHWIGEESEKLKEVVHKHAALQRVGVNGNPEAVSSKSSVSEEKRVTRITDKDSVSNIAENSLNPEFSSSLYSPSSIISGETLVGGDENDPFVTMPSPFRGTRRDISPFSKKPRQKEKWEGQNGFEELRRFIKQGGDFGKDFINILQERAESEHLYAKSLAKMAAKLSKSCREIPGSSVDACRGVAAEMEGRGEIHRHFANSLVEEIVKPLKLLLDNHHKTRKSVENNVDKSSRILLDWRISEGKAKKISHTAARENEKLQDAMLDVRIQKSPSIGVLQQGGNKITTEKEIKNAEKDCAKLDNKRRKAEEAVKRADVEYYTLCIRAERARVDWEMSVLKGSSLLQNLENQRLDNLKNFLELYLRLTSDMNPLIEQIVTRLKPQIEACDTQKDLTVVRNIIRSSGGPSEQLLPDFYCEHTTLAMNRERRKHALIKLLHLVKTDLERERRSRNSLKGLSQTLNSQDNQNITDKLYHIRSMLTYLEGARFKLHSALLELDHKPRNTHPLAPHIQVTRDRTGLQQSILKVPLWLKNNHKGMEDRDHENDSGSQTNGSCIDIKNEVLISHFDRSFNRSKSTSEILIRNQQVHQNEKSQTLPLTDIDSPEFDRGIADGGSNQPDSDFDEFSSQDEEEVSIKKDKLDDSGHISRQRSNSTTIVLCKCKALYSYTPKLYDELELTPGDVIDVHIKQEDGWWLGAIKNRMGIFPATYVEELS